MAFFFEGTQFDVEYTPKRLGNWAVPRWSPSHARPAICRPSPKPICDINGRFLPGAPRGTSGPFGHYMGTWDMPRKITREVASQLAQEPPPGRFDTWLNPVCRRITQTPQNTKENDAGDTNAENDTVCDKLECTRGDKKNEATNTFVKTDGSGKEIDNFNNSNILPEITNNGGCGYSKLEPYTPGNVTNLDQRHESVNILDNKITGSLNELPQQTSHIFRAENTNLRKTENSTRIMKEQDKENLLELPVVHDASYSRKKHMENMQHQPLPDKLLTTPFMTYEEMMVKPHAIAFSGQYGKGPTSCTKLKVYRPQTGVTVDKIRETDVRPATTSTQKQLREPTLIDLAIRWDYRPKDKRYEPKPPKHIDGSNGSQAPAVFTMVHTPKPQKTVATGYADPLFTQGNAHDGSTPSPAVNFEKNMTNKPRKDSCEVQNCPQHNPKHNQPNPQEKTPSRSSSSRHSSNKNSGTSNSTSNANYQNDLLQNDSEKKRLHQSSPNFPADTNQLRNSSDSIRSSSKRSSNSNSSSKLRVPKMKDPFPKKSYAIPTLAPPFKFNKESNEGYPEHWRLSSVYQHAFKPPHLRKVPLISCVFK